MRLQIIHRPERKDVVLYAIHSGTMRVLRVYENLQDDDAVESVLADIARYAEDLATEFLTLEEPVYRVQSASWWDRVLSWMERRSVRVEVAGKSFPLADQFNAEQAAREVAQ